MDGVEICAKVEQLDPWQRSTLYPVTPKLSVDAVHDRSIWDEETAEAERFAGAEGAVVSIIVVVKLKSPEMARLLNASFDFTR